MVGVCGAGRGWGVLGGARRAWGVPVAAVKQHCNLLVLFWRDTEHATAEPGTLALNAIQRRCLKLSSGDSLPVRRFFLPPAKFQIVVINMEIDFITKNVRQQQLDAQVLAPELLKRFAGQVFTVTQRASFEFQGVNYQVNVTAIVTEDAAVSGGSGSEGMRTSRGLLVDKSTFVFETPPNSGIKIINQRAGMATNLFKTKEINFEKLGIGGLDKEFADIFRRAFASRVFPPSVVSRLGIMHVKGMLLHGPPGTGKTLIARQIGKMLNGREPKVVNGPELLNKYVGQSEENVRKLFAEAEADQLMHGDDSDLHIIIFDEIDAICKQRGSNKDSTGVQDTMVNQLLTKIDGVDALNNILLIGMTNRKDLLDEAMLRPGRLEVQIEIGLPDEHGRLQILKIHTNKMDTNKFLAQDVDLAYIAENTKNYSGAELEGLVKSAVSFALNRQIDVNNLSGPLDEDNIKVAKEDFDRAMEEVRPAFGAAVQTLEMFRMNGMIEYGSRYTHIRSTCGKLVEQVHKSSRTPLMTLLLEGPPGSGKTALAATVGIESTFPFVKIVSAESLIGLSEQSKCNAIVKTFDDAYKSAMSLIILDDIERLLEYVAIGPRFSNLVLQTLLVLVKRLPPKGRKIMVVATTSSLEVMESLGLSEAFNVCINVPRLTVDEIFTVLKALDVFDPADLDGAMAALDVEMPIKQLLMLVEMAAAHYPDVEGQKKRIQLDHFVECMADLKR
eukprot:jgi/Mesvir1/4346/Mv02430-RA.2